MTNDIHVALDHLRRFENGKLKFDHEETKKDIETAFDCNLYDYDIDIQHFMLLTFVLFHEIGHSIHFEKINNKKNNEDPYRCCKLGEVMRKRIHKKLSLLTELSDEEKEVIRYQFYKNSIQERFANRYAITIIQKFIEDKIIDLNNINIFK
jgi:hypothetical protein